MSIRVQILGCISFCVFLFSSCNLALSDCDKADRLQKEIDNALLNYGKKIKEKKTESIVLGFEKEFLAVNSVIITDEELAGISNEYYEMKDALNRSMEIKENCSEQLVILEGLAAINKKKIRITLEKFKILFQQEIKKRSEN